MTVDMQSVFAQALSLPAASKVDLVDLLLSSIEQEGSAAQDEIDAAWAREARDRFQAFLEGKIVAEPREEVIQALRARHASPTGLQER